VCASAGATAITALVLVVIGGLVLTGAIYDARDVLEGRADDPNLAIKVLLIEILVNVELRCYGGRIVTLFARKRVSPSADPAPSASAAIERGHQGTRCCPCRRPAEAGRCLRVGAPVPEIA
jgi:hypothetical protein